jgi:hypothetical protein
MVHYLALKKVKMLSRNGIGKAKSTDQQHNQQQTSHSHLISLARNNLNLHINQEFVVILLGQPCEHIFGTKC